MATRSFPLTPGAISPGRRTRPSPAGEDAAAQECAPFFFFNRARAATTETGHLTCRVQAVEPGTVRAHHCRVEIGFQTAEGLAGQDVQAYRASAAVPVEKQWLATRTTLSLEILTRIGHRHDLRVSLENLLSICASRAEMTRSIWARSSGGAAGDLVHAGHQRGQVVGDDEIDAVSGERVDRARCAPWIPGCGRGSGSPDW